MYDFYSKTMAGGNDCFGYSSFKFLVNICVAWSLITKECVNLSLEVLKSVHHSAISVVFDTVTFLMCNGCEICILLLIFVRKEKSISTQIVFTLLVLHHSVVRWHRKYLCNDVELLHPEKNK